ncbi:hypothetical protein E4U54_007333 [Claviceps lovelessii]|nr:hypothetical protein E4U54_007333 [Claviceps lovelessii]
MMNLKASSLWALIFLVLVVQFAQSQSFAPTEKDGGATSITSPVTSPARSKITDAAGRDQDDRESRVSSAQPTPEFSSASTQTTASSVLPTATSSGFLDNSTFYNGKWIEKDIFGKTYCAVKDADLPLLVTIPAGQLPLPPQLTPGWGVAGVIMLVTGVVYTLVGIKNRWIHTFFSTAYMTALGVAVLIVYVMNVPVGNALQSGYVVAVIMSGCAVGGASMFFKELTEGLGCALGGFCISMWLLCLVPGGLLHTVTSKAVFIASFTLVGFALYFSIWTRDWSLIVLIAFGGSTVTVLGIDCFSRAGLKEFWAYVWAINDNLFPLGADTYPITKGIRVEIAAVVFIFLAGIISQIKLWRIVREKRAKRAADRAQDQQDLEREEENVGRQIEESNGRERREWERVYGNGNADSITESRATDIGETGSEKGLRPGYTSSKRKTSAGVIEMAEMSESDQSRHEPDALMATEDAEEGKITVRVAADDIPDSSTDVEGETLDEKTEPKQEVEDFGDSKRHSKVTTGSRRVSQAQTITEAPEVVPLPFTVPEATEVKSDGDRSSIATFADDAEAATSAAPRKHISLARKLSKGSASLLQSFSQISEHAGGGDDSASRAGQSTEELVMGGVRQTEDDERSLAATVDDESLSVPDVQSILEDTEQKNASGEIEPARRSIEINAQLGKEDEELHNGSSLPQDTTRSQPVPATVVSEPVSVVEVKPPLDTDNANTGVGESQQDEEKVPETCHTPSIEPNLPQSPDKTKSVASVSSIPASLTKDRLPRSLSRVAMSYRTNEWAKHLSHAECPEPEELLVASTRVTQKSKEPREQPVPVNIEELQQTAENGAPTPGVRRSFSIATEIESPASDPRQLSKQELSPVTDVVVPISSTGRESPFGQRMPRSPTAPPAPTLKKIPSGLRHSSSTFMPIAEESISQTEGELIIQEAHDFPQPLLSRQSSVAALDTMSQASVPRTTRSPTPGVVSYASPQTLMGQREMFLRSKSQGNLLSSTPEPPFVGQGPESDAESLHNYAIYAAALNLSDPDDVPLSQRKEIIRQSSVMSLSRSSVQPATGPPRPLPGYESSDSLAFKSHQPNRSSLVPSIVAREAQLASFRQSVQYELRSGSPIVMNSGRETPFRSASLLGGGREAEVQRNIEMQRNVLMGQKEAEAQRREMQKREKEHVDRAFDERMRNGDMLEAHRAAMRRMQKEAK